MANDESPTRRCTACGGWGTDMDDGYSHFTCPVCEGTGYVRLVTRTEWVSIRVSDAKDGE